MKTKKTSSSRDIKHTRKHTNKNNTINKTIIDILTLVKDYYKEQNDKFRIKTYERALYQIRKWNKPITKGSELSEVEGIGKGMIEKIDTIISSGTLPIIKEKNIVKSASKYSNNNNVQTILGFNSKFINEIKNKYNARTIYDFRKVLDSGGNNYNKLTHIQHLGLKYYEDLHHLIPRDEITYLAHKLNKIISGIDNGIDKNIYTVMLSGSYPSHTKEYSKDIDIIIVRNKESGDSGELTTIINQIKKDKELELEIISLGETKFMGLILSPLSHKMRHIDIRFVTIDELPYTWLYYSSGQIFNKLIRDKLKKKGYKLNEYGLFNSKNNEKIRIDADINANIDIKKEGKLLDKLLDYIEKVEREVFKFADMEYKNVKTRY